MNKVMKMIIVACFLAFTATFSIAEKHEKIPIKEVTSLLLSRGKMATGRRAAPVPQLNCLSNCRDSPDTIYCGNAGHDGEDVVWECKSDPPGAVFRDLNVQCEGYDYPDDPNILKGSCGIEFRMASTPGSSKYSPNDQEPNPAGALFVCVLIMGALSCLMNDDGGSSSYRSSSYRPSSSNFWTGAAAGYAVGRSSGRGSSWGSSNSSWGGRSSWGGGGSSYVRTTRR